MLRKYMYLSFGVLMVLLVAVTGLTIYYNTEDTTDAAQQEEMTDPTSEISTYPVAQYTNTGATLDENDKDFYLVSKDEQVEIYRGEEREFYDYADVNVESMPIEIKEQLKYGLYINSIEELYEFLQTYSS